MLDYISSPSGTIGEVMTIVASSGSTTANFFAFFTDSQGSVNAVANPQTWAMAELRSYDAWGKMRNTTGTAGSDDTSDAVANASSETTGFIGQEYVKPIALVNLNARMFDPVAARFMSADPQGGSGGQGLNPYSYVMNNPLTDADPTGMCGFFQCPGKSIAKLFQQIPILQPLIAIAAVITFQYEIFPALAGYSSFAALTAASPGLAALDVGISGAIGAAINTGTLRGTLIGAATAEAFWGVGGVKVDIANATTNQLARFGAGVALHAAVGCVSSAAGGGQCGSGALSGGLGEVFSDLGARQNMFVRGSIAALGGGTGSALTGGKFGDGFALGAAGYLFNGAAQATANGGLDGVGDYVGKLWNLPNTIIGLTYGGLGYGVGLITGSDPDIGFGGNAVQFTNNPFASRGAITIGNVEVFGGSTNDLGADGNIMGEHEPQHTYQGQLLGPLYLPSNILGGAAGLIFGGGFHAPQNRNEVGPQMHPPRPWPP
jgi:RHS repeat-associated protein